MILCSHFLWFCDEDSDVTNRDLTPNHSLVGGSGTAHCATPVLWTCRKYRMKEMSPFNFPSTAQWAPAQTPWAGFHLCALQSKIKTTHHTPWTIVDLTEQCQEKRIHLTGLVFLNNPIKASRELLLEEFIFSTSRKDETSGMQMSKKKDSAQVSCHCLRKAPPPPVRQDIRDGFLQLSPLLHRWFLSAFWCYHCIIRWQTWFSSGRFLDHLSCNTWPIFPLLQLVIMWTAHEWVPFYEVLRNYKFKHSNLLDICILQTVIRTSTESCSSFLLPVPGVAV